MHTFQAMNSVFETSGLPTQSSRKAESWFAFVERTLSRFLPESELSRLNRSKGNPFLASALLYQVLVEANRYFIQTAGLFNPYLGKLIESLGYSRSFEMLVGEQTSMDEESSHAKEVTDTPVQFNPGMKSVTLHKQVSVDLGGIAKGWSAHQLAQILKLDGLTEGAINAGGDITLWGTKERAMDIGIANPYQPEEDLLMVNIRGEAGIATSSMLKRRWKDKDGNVNNHILDPRSRGSVASDLTQVTVIAPNLIEAEVYAKCMLIIGSKACFTWLEQMNPRCAAIGVLKDGTYRMGGDLAAYCMEGGLYNERIS
jgi:thiamine biosynthesis lipoprotein